MQLNKNQVIEINMKDLLFHFFYRWRSILLVAIICGIAFGTYQYFSVKSIHDEGKQTKDERQYQLDLQSYQENLERNRTQIAVLSNRLEGQKKYQEKSIYIQLDAQNVWLAQNKYLIKVNQRVLDALPTGSIIDPADSILPAYTTVLSEDLDEQMLKEAFNTEEAEYVKELVSIGTNTGDNTITIWVKGSSKESVEKGLALINRLVKELSEGKAQEINAHQLVDLGKTISLGADEELARKQTDLTKAMLDDQQALQQARIDLDALEAKKEPVKPGNHVLKMAVIGFVVGVFLLLFVYFVHFVYRGRINNSKDLALRYKLPIFGELATTGQIHSKKGLDKLLSKWELGNGTLDDEKAFNNIAALIEEKQEVEKVLLISTLKEEDVGIIKDALTKRLSDKTVCIQVNAVQNSDAITEASKADAVIVVEKKRVSRYKDIDRIVESLIISEAKVIGAVVL